jgi:DUF1707 SHOCT-like domain
MSTQRTGRIRVGDRERTAVADRLTAHTADGRLTVDELEARLERVHAAVYGDELAAVEADLPTTAPRGRPAPWPVPPWVALLVLGVIAAAALSAVVGHPFFPPVVAAFVLWRFGAFRHPIRRSRS